MKNFFKNYKTILGAIIGSLVVILPSFGINFSAHESNTVLAFAVMIVSIFAKDFDK
jgi:siderophore synthetase component